MEDMLVFTIFLFQDFNKRQVTKPGHRTDTRQVCFSLKSMLYTLLAAKCVSLSLQVIAPQHTSPSFPASVLHIKGKSGKHRTLPFMPHSTALSVNRVLNGFLLVTLTHVSAFFLRHEHRSDAKQVYFSVHVAH